MPDREGAPVRRSECGSCGRSDTLRSRAVRVSTPSTLRSGCQVLGLGANDDRVTPAPPVRVTRGLDRIACSLKPREESRDGAPRGERARSAWRRQRRDCVARAAPEACGGGNAGARGADVMRMPLSALRLPHFYLPGGDRFVPCRAKARMPQHRENDVACSSAPARSAGGGGHLANRGGGGGAAYTLSPRVKEVGQHPTHTF